MPDGDLNASYNGDITNDDDYADEDMLGDSMVSDPKKQMLD